MSNIVKLSLSEIVDGIKKKNFTSEEVTKVFIENSLKSKKLNTYITSCFEEALKSAKNFDKKKDNKGLLSGVPIAVKDLFCTKDVKTTAGSKILHNFIPTYESTVTNNLWSEGAFLLGKLNCDEFAMGSSNETSFFGNVKNPFDEKLVPGGSSGGSASALAAGLTPATIGTDTGGSVRVPASLCGITGLKPTFGMISRFGVTPLSWSMDHVGPLAKTAKDTAIALNTLVKYDPKDPDSTAISQQDYTKGLDEGIKGIRIGIPKNFIWDLVDPEVKLAFYKSIEETETLGAVVKEIVNPNLELINMAGSIVQTSEAATIHRANVLNKGNSFDPIIRMRIETGLFITAESYIKAQQIRMDEKARLIKQFDEVDLIATPTTSIPAPRLDQERIEINNHDVHIREALLRITRIFSTIGLPAISIPCGFTKKKLPIGLQFVAKPFNEQTLLKAAHCFQEITNWHKVRPDF